MSLEHLASFTIISIMKCPFVKLSLFGLAWVVLAPLAHGYLGGFEQSDGYHTPNVLAGYMDVNGTGVIPTGSIAGDATFYLNNDAQNPLINWVPSSAYPTTANDPSHGPDVTRYNAGQFGLTSGGPGGVGVDIADNTGLWRAVSGGRLNEDAAAPNYSGTTSLDRDHIIGWRYPGARTGSNVLDVLAGEQDMIYDYSLDSRDLAGSAPSATGSHLVAMNFWLCPTYFDDSYSSNVFGLAVKDSLGQQLVEVGFTGDNRIQYRVGSSSLWETTNVIAGVEGWSNVSMQIDTASNRVSLNVMGWDDISMSLGSDVSLLNGADLGVDAGSLETLRWSAEGGLLDAGSGDTAYKNTFDDFEFSVQAVPEPGSAILIGLGLIAGWRRRR